MKPEKEIKLLVIGSLIILIILFILDIFFK